MTASIRGPTCKGLQRSRHGSMSRGLPAEPKLPLRIVPKSPHLAVLTQTEGMVVPRSHSLDRLWQVHSTWFLQHRNLKFQSTTKVPAKHVSKYYRISWRIRAHTHLCIGGCVCVCVCVCVCRGGGGGGGVYRPEQAFVLNFQACGCACYSNLSRGDHAAAT